MVQNPNSHSAIIPVIAASMVSPFAEAMRRYGKVPDPIYVECGLAQEKLTDDTFIPAQTWYDFVETAAKTVSDQYFGYRVGSDRNVEHLPNIQNLEFAEATLGEIITGLIVDAENLLTLATYDLTIDGTRTSLKSKRTFKPTRPPAQIDGFSIGFLMSIFRRFVPDMWTSREMTISVCDPGAVPPEAHREFKILKGKETGALIQFPTQWLLARTNSQTRQTGVGKGELNRDFIERVRGLISLRLSDPNLNIEAIARQTSMSVSSLQERLNSSGTTYMTELKTIRVDRARELLHSALVPIEDVAKAVGYRDGTAFSRAFKSWTGDSPRNYRRRSEDRKG